MNNRNAQLLEEFRYYLETGVTCKGRLRRENTLKASYCDVSQFLNFIGELPAESVTYNNANKWIESLGETAAATRNRKKASLRSFYNCLVANRLIKEHPLKNLKPEVITRGKYGNQKTRDWLEGDEITRFKDVVNKEAANPIPTRNQSKKTVKMNALRSRAIIFLILETGIRVKEVITLKKDKLRMDQDGVYYIIITPERSKNHKDREIPVPKYVVDYISEYLKSMTFIPDNDCIFLSQNGNELSSSDILSKIKEYAKKANIKKNITTHSLRHTFASYKLNVEKENISLIAEWMGDTEKVLKDIYLHRKTREGTCILFDQIVI